MYAQLNTLKKMYYTFHSLLVNVAKCFRSAVNKTFTLKKKNHVMRITKKQECDI